MQIINRARRSGKTLRLIYASEVTGCPIVVPYEGMIRSVKSMAKDLGCNIPEPISADLLKRKTDDRDVRSRIQFGVLVDEAGSLIKPALESYLKCPVVAITMSEKMEGEAPRTDPVSIKSKEMTALEYLRNRYRMHKHYENNCNECPLNIPNSGGTFCGAIEQEDAEAAVAIVRSWGAEHPETDDAAAAALTDS